jgi:hypothetical protein
MHRALPLLILLTACGSVSFLDGNIPAVPAITAFTAAPATLPVDGGTTELSWTVQDATALFLDPGDANVTGFLRATIPVTATTTYALTARNALGQDTRTVTVTVGP